MFDPFSLSLTAVSVGLQAAGLFGGASARSDQNAATQAQIQAQMELEKQRKKQMELEARRRNLEIVRNQQRARAIALSAATNQGSSEGSGLQGGYGQISGQANTQLLATSQNLQIGRNMFNLNQDISSARMAYANAGTELANWNAVGQFGQTLMSVGPQLKSLSGGFNPSSGPMTWGGGNSNPYMASNSSSWYS
jgi:hypothetical protein